ncbi:MAG: UPF0280 family protein [Pseudomonadota bacterium]
MGAGAGTGVEAGVGTGAGTGAGTGPGIGAGAEAARRRALAAAEARFSTVLGELVAELALLRTPMAPGAPLPRGQIARRMDRAVRPHAAGFVTRMAAVAGAVADTVLAAMVAAAPLQRAYANNGGDIALHLAPGARYAIGVSDHRGARLGQVTLEAGQGVGGIATSGRHGRSLSLGIADSVTVLAENAAAADAAATLVANAVDLPGHPGIARTPASALDPDSDLGERPVVTGCRGLAADEAAAALAAGAARAEAMRRAGLIAGAALFLEGQVRTVGRLDAAALAAPAAEPA